MSDNGVRPDPVASGLLLAPGIGPGTKHRGLVAISRRARRSGIPVHRVELDGASGGGRMDETLASHRIRTSARAFSESLGSPMDRLAIGGRSFGGRIGSMVVAEGLEAAALVLISYPLHPPGRSDLLQTAHFPQLRVPCLFVSGDQDPFGLPSELEAETSVIPGPVTLHVVEGGHRLRTAAARRTVARVVVSWLTSGAPASGHRG